MSLSKLVSIVDDDSDITTLFRDALVGICGITIFTFTDPLLALKHFQKNQGAYVLVISDYMMPGLNGMELLKKMKDMKECVRTILMTAYDIEDTVFQDYRKEEIINGFFQKPVRLTKLVDEVNTQLHSYEMPNGSSLQ